MRVLTEALSSLEAFRIGPIVQRLTVKFLDATEFMIPVSAVLVDNSQMVREVIWVTVVVVAKVTIGGRLLLLVLHFVLHIHSNVKQDGVLIGDLAVQDSHIRLLALYVLWKSVRIAFFKTCWCISWIFYYHEVFPMFKSLLRVTYKGSSSEQISWIQHSKSKVINV